jgi:hypothetical protein
VLLSPVLPLSRGAAAVSNGSQRSQMRSRVRSLKAGSRRASLRRLGRFRLARDHRTRHRGCCRTSVITRPMYSMPGSGSFGWFTRQCSSSSSRSTSSCSWTSSSGYRYASFRAISRTSCTASCWFPCSCSRPPCPASARFRRQSYVPLGSGTRVSHHAGLALRLSAPSTPGLRQRTTRRRLRVFRPCCSS